MTCLSSLRTLILLRVTELEARIIQTSSLEDPGFLRDGGHQKTKLEFWEEKRARGVLFWGCSLVPLYGLVAPHGITLWLNLTLVAESTGEDLPSGVALGSVFACKTESFAKKAQGECCRGGFGPFETVSRQQQLFLYNVSFNPHCQLSEQGSSIPGTIKGH